MPEANHEFGLTESDITAYESARTAKGKASLTCVQPKCASPGEREDVLDALVACSNRYSEMLMSHFEFDMKTVGDIMRPLCRLAKTMLPCHENEIQEMLDWYDTFPTWIGLEEKIKAAREDQSPVLTNDELRQVLCDDQEEESASPADLAESDFVLTDRDRAEISRILSTKRDQLPDISTDHIIIEESQ